MKAAAFWIGGALVMWAGAMGVSVDQALYIAAGHHPTFVSHAFGRVGLLLIAAGAFLWRKA